MRHFLGDNYASLRKKLDSADLAAIEILALRFFLLSAIVPEVAAGYVLLRVSENPQCSAEETYRSILVDWVQLARKMTAQNGISLETEAALRERDGHRCFVTGMETAKPTHLVAPSIVNDKDLLPEGYLRPMLDAVILPEKAEEMFSLLKLREQKPQLENLLLLESTSIKPSYCDGMFQITKTHYADSSTAQDVASCGWDIQPTSPGNQLPKSCGRYLYKIPKSPDPDSCPCPSFFFTQIHNTIAPALHFHRIEQEIKSGWPIEKGSSPKPLPCLIISSDILLEPWKLGKLGRTLLRNTLSLLPAFVRVALYQRVDALIEYFDLDQKGQYVKMLPFGLCLKRGTEQTPNEANALVLVEKHTSINAPRFIDSVMIDKSSGFLLMTRIFGRSLEQVIYRTTFEEREQIGKDLAKWITELRQIPNKSNYLIADTLGGPIQCRRHGDGEPPWGPYNSIADFTNQYARYCLQHKHERPLSVLYEKKYDVVFTHSDLHMSNIFIRGGKLHALIDFEHAGFKPEYWELIRALWSYGSATRRELVYGHIFGDRYDEELEAERFILINGGFVL